MFIPEILKKKKLPLENNNPLYKLSEFYDLTTFGDLDKNILKEVYENNVKLFWNIIKQLAFYGIIFNNKAAKYNIIKNAHYAFLDIDPKYFDEKIKYEYYPNLSKIKNLLLDFGILYKRNLSTIPVKSILYYYNNLSIIEELININYLIKGKIRLHDIFIKSKYNKIIEKLNDNNLIYVNRIVNNYDYKKLSKKFNLNPNHSLVFYNKIINFINILNNNKVYEKKEYSFKIKIEDIIQNSLLNKIVRALKKDKIIYISDLPKNKFQFLLSYRGVGIKKAKLFINQINNYEKNDINDKEVKYSNFFKINIPNNLINEEVLNFLPKYYNINSDLVKVFEIFDIVMKKDKKNKLKIFIKKLLKVYNLINNISNINDEKKLLKKAFMYKDYPLENLKKVEKGKKIKKIINKLLEDNIYYLKNLNLKLDNYKKYKGVGKVKISKFRELLGSELNKDHYWINYKNKSFKVYKEVYQRNIENDNIKKLTNCNYNEVLCMGFDLYSEDNKNIIFEYLVNKNKDIRKQKIKNRFNKIIEKIKYKDYYPNNISTRAWEIIYYRNIKHYTLEKIGDKYNISRERVRQILKKNYKSNYFNVINLYLGILKKSLNKRLIIKINSFFNSKEIKEYDIIKYFLNKKKVKVFKGEYFLDINIKKINKLINNVISKIQSKFGKINIEKATIENYLYFEFGKKFSDYTKRNDECLEEIVYSKFVEKNGKLSLKGMNKHKKFKAIFKNYFSNGFDRKKDTKKFKKYYCKIFCDNIDNISTRNIVSIITRRNNDYLIIDRGVYLHKDHINVKKEDLEDIIKNIESIFDKENIYQIFCKRLYEDNIETCNRLKIKSYYHLHSLIKIFYPKKFYYPKSPWIYKSNNYEFSTRESDIIDFLKKFNKPINYDLIKKEFVEKRGWKKYMLHPLYTSNEIIRVDIKKYFLRSELNIKSDILDNLIKKIRKRLKNREIVSIKKIYYEKKAYYKIKGIYSSYCLYEILKSNKDVSFYLPKYPIILDKYIDNFNKKRAILKFIKRKNGPVFFSTIKREFLDRLKFKKTALYNWLNYNEKIVTIEKRKEYIHIANIGINEKKKNLLFDLIVESIENSNNYYISLKEVIFDKNVEFPKVKNNLKWTTDMIKYFIDGFPGLLLLGYNDEIVLFEDNTRNIQSEQDFIYYFVKENFDGHVRIKRLIKELRKIDFIIKSIPKNYKTYTKGLYEFRENEVIIKDLLNVKKS
ncbi:MAG: hypothetical protein FXF47_04960 [Candidatus Mcinerneyibacterium aminivorans]|uniref:RNA polymerase sigma-70 region 4 domain-containing protein n=1 Tax=Candidatus Mcinerneyibacterium aminivorans TaxID=2703815 RepID=A0A5D0MHC6_9BACT|nr:MAG: hypothetical protein FXF47_04960 [Candidatus Mcinerneyibacterium aminivorans]